MKRNQNYKICQMGANYYLLPRQIGIKTEFGLPVLNDTGRWIWDALAEDTTLEDLISSFSLDFGINRQEADEDVRAFLSDLTEVGLLEGWPQ